MRRALVIGLVCAGALVVPAQAFAHAVLLRTEPSASVVLNTPPQELRLTYSEVVEPRFATVLVEDATGAQVQGIPARPAGQPRTLVVPLKNTRSGWYLVVWRVISQDGHPVRGAFTFAVGPNPGPSPEFPLPSLTETAATTQLVVVRWLAFLGLMTAVGLLAFRVLVIRRLPVRRRGSTIALAAALGLALVAIPLYVLLATAQFALRPWTAFGDVVPLMDASSFGRSFLDLELVLALFAVAAAAVVVTERPALRQRTIAELLALIGAAVSACALLLVPGLGGHAAQKSPRGLALALDWAHVATASIWIGGLVGLLVLWSSVERGERTALLGGVVPRFSRIAFCSVMLLVATGTVASVLHLPTLGSLWETSYGQALLFKIALLGAALLLAGVNLAWTKPRLEVAAARRDEKLGASTAVLLRRLVGGEVIIVTGAILGAAILTSLAPPSQALAKAGNALARVGPGAVTRTVEKDGYRFAIRIAPNRAALPNDFGVTITRGGRPVQGARVKADFEMLDMQMQPLGYLLPETAPGVYSVSKPALVMVGHWGLRFTMTPRGGKDVQVLIVDKAGG